MTMVQSLNCGHPKDLVHFGKYHQGSQISPPPSASQYQKKPSSLFKEDSRHGVYEPVYKMFHYPQSQMSLLGKIPETAKKNIIKTVMTITVIIITLNTIKI